MCGCVSVFSIFRWTYLRPFNDPAYAIVLLPFKWELLVVLIVVYSVFVTIIYLEVAGFEEFKYNYNYAVYIRVCFPAR